MFLVQGVKLVGEEGQVELIIPQVVGLGAVPQPGQLQPEGTVFPVLQIDLLEGTVPGLFLAVYGQVQSLPVEGKAAIQVQNIKIKVIKRDHGRHPFRKTVYVRIPVLRRPGSWNEEECYFALVSIHSVLNLE